MSAVERSLFAAKGWAVPSGARPEALPEPAPLSAGSVQAIVSDPAQPPLPLVDDAVPAPMDAPRPLHGEEAPVGSLLTFRLRRGAGTAALADDGAPVRQPAMPSDADRAPAADDQAPDVAAAPAMPAPDVAAAPHGAPPSKPAQQADTHSETTSSRIDRPLFPPTPSESVAAVERATAPASPPQSAYTTPRSSAARTVLPAAAAVMAIAVVGWLVADSTPPAAPEAAPETAAAAPAPQPDPASEPAVAPAPVAAAAPSAVAGEPAAAPAPAALADADATAVAAEPAPPSLPSAVAAPADPSAEAPTLDVVRVEPGAPPVLAGRAAPGAELIVLDNGMLLGTAIADGNGEWALVTDAALPPGRHELSLALKTPDGAVVIEQADTETPAAPEATVPSPDDLLVPPAKPIPGAAAEKLYVIQLASVPSVADAEREWVRLQAAYPALLGSREVEVNAAEIGGRGTFYRLRTGPFPDREAARLLCRELNAAGQECLVVRQVAGE